MNFDNPDNRCKLFLAVLGFDLLVFITSIWIGDGRMAATGGVLLIPVIAACIWMCVGYDEESYEEAAERKRNRRNKGLDKTA